MNEEEDKIDVVSLDIPLLIRLLEYAREEVNDDATLHRITENIVALDRDDDFLTMKDYDNIINSDNTPLNTDNMNSIHEYRFKRISGLYN